MPVVNTPEWYEALAAAVNRSPEYAEAAKDWAADMTFVIHGDDRSPYTQTGENLYFYVDLYHGKVRSWKKLERLDEVQAAFKIIGPASVWEEVLVGMMDPLQAMLQGLITLEGDINRIMKNVGAVQALVDCLNQVETLWPKGKPPYA